VISRNGYRDFPIMEGITKIEVSDAEGNSGTAAWIEVTGVTDVDKAVAAMSAGHAFVVVRCSNWKIIPLENLIAEFHRKGEKIYAYMSKKDEMELAFSILEKGVDGIVIPATAISDARELMPRLGEERRVPILAGKITKVLDVGNGERACIDTASRLSVGEGLLVGSRASFFFLVHSETIPSEYIPTREFRVNAGAIHSYVLGDDGKTRYLSELKAADHVRMVTNEGDSREVVIGRVKIERRPLVMIEASVAGESGTIMLQKAETIRLMRSDGVPISVTDLKVGDEIMIHVAPGKARHFGGEIDEFILER
jgi:3-dehydroquinate synthase II